MDLVELLQQWLKRPQTGLILQQSDAPNPQVTHLQGIDASAETLQVLATSLLQSNTSNWLLYPDKESALYAFTDIDNLLNHLQKSVFALPKGFFFPDSFQRPGEFNSAVQSAQVLERTELLTDLLKHPDRKRIIVSYPQAMIEQVISAGGLQKHILHLKKGEAIDLDFVTELLVELRFERTDFVYEPGQFSIRGGIVDIFSFGNDYPYRLELFGREVESIRTFDPATQLSVANVAYVTIIPNTQVLDDQQANAPLLDVIPTNSIFWIKNNADQILTLEALAAKDQAMAENAPALRPDFERRWSDDLERFPVFEFGTRTAFAPYLTIKYNILPQPSFNKNFELLMDELIAKQHLGYRNYIFADNPKQIERFNHIFSDLGQNRKGRVVNAQVQFTPLNLSLHQGFIDQELKQTLFTDHQIFERYHRFKQKAVYSKSNAITLKTLTELQAGDFVVHVDHGVGRYSGLQKLEINGVTQEVVRIFYKDNDVLYVNINSLHKISKFSGKEGNEPKINKLGSDAWEQLKRKTKNKVKELAFDLIQLYAKRKAAKGFAFNPDTYLQNELEASFIYEDTPDQLKATNDVKADMEKPFPMDRLVCGDVGFGKTEVAIRAAFKAVTDGKQVAVLVPTTILAMQHAKTFSERLKEFPCTIEYLNRFKTTKQQKETIERLAEGKVDILVGTHMLLSNKVKYKDLGLMIIDEEQKFGVAAKDKLKLIKTNVDTLTLTATPIPRTLQFSMMGARDLSVIHTPPPNRQPVETRVCTFDIELIKGAIENEVYRGGQVYFIHNKVQDIGEMAEMIRKACPGFEVGVAHGQMDGETLEQRMMGFINREYDVLVCTNIVESGLDITNANTIIINHAHHHGLSDLHQLRGRVGRNNKKAYCFLIAPPMHVLTPEGRRRLQTIEQFSDLGSGFQISMRDLDIRGAGNLLGGEQSGFITEIGFEMYHKILDEAIRELKAGEFKELFADSNTDSLLGPYVRECAIETDTEMLIPDDYVNSIAERLQLYRQLDDVANEAALRAFEAALKDRFGPIPASVFELFEAVRVRWSATSLGFERIQLKDNIMRGYFISEKDNKFFETEQFMKTMAFIQSEGSRAGMKQSERHLIITVKSISNLQQAEAYLQRMTKMVNN